MRVLQLFSDWKWTGPAEPMLQLVRSLRDRGHRVELVCSEAPAGIEDCVARRARAAGVTPLFEMPHARGAAWWRDAAPAARLRAALDEVDVDVVHTWHTRDHVLALRAAARRRRAGRTRVVRSWTGAEPVVPRPWNRWLFGPATDGLLCVSPGLAAANARLRGGRPLRGVLGAVELERFCPGPPEPGVRESLGLEPGQRVVGIVARVQRHRRFDLLLEAAARLFKADPAARLLVLGRGTRLREVAEEPAARLGIAERVVLAGYRTGDYVQALRSMDVFTFLVPGSDGGCRALLEATACGLAAVTGPRPPLPEIVSDGETGVVVEEHPDALAEAWSSLLAEPERRAHLGAAARARAVRLFAPERQARLVEDLYREVLSAAAR